MPPEIVSVDVASRITGSLPWRPSEIEASISIVSNASKHTPGNAGVNGTHGTVGFGVSRPIDAAGVYAPLGTIVGQTVNNPAPKQPGIALSKRTESTEASSAVASSTGPS